MHPIGLTEVLGLALLALIFAGAARLPQIGKDLGDGSSEEMP